MHDCVSILDSLAKGIVVSTQYCYITSLPAAQNTCMHIKLISYACETQKYQTEELEKEDRIVLLQI